MDRISTAPYIEFRHVSVRYTEEVSALKDVSLSITKGDFVFFCGSTGAGKSTLLKLLTRDVRQTDGVVVFDGQDLNTVSDWSVPALRRKMGIVPQDYALLPRKRAWENVAYAMRAVGNTRREVRRKWPRILEMVGLIPRAEAFPHELSGGEQQRVAIARALINDPQLLIADEPTGNLDPDRSWEIMEILIELNKQGTTILVASHDVLVMDRMREIARIITLDHGRIIADISPEPVIPDIVEPSLFTEPAPVTISEKAVPVSEQLENVESTPEKELSEIEPTPEAPHA